ncbi:MAG: hypothetical protein D6731_22685, partial [Planctomycetota bacterium]
MPELTPQDIALGRAALRQGVIDRPQLDAAVALLRAGRSPDLGRALVQTGALAPAQVDLLASRASPSAPFDPSEANTLHDDATSGAGATLPATPFAPLAFGDPGGAPDLGAFSEQPTLADLPPDSAFGGTGSGFAFGSGGSGFGGGGSGAAPLGLGENGSLGSAPGGFGSAPGGFGSAPG